MLLLSVHKHNKCRRYLYIHIDIFILEWKRWLCRRTSPVAARTELFIRKTHLGHTAAGAAFGARD